MKKIFLTLAILTFMCSSAWALTYEFYGTSDTGGVGMAEMEINVLTNTLLLTLDNTSPLTVDDVVNAPGIVGFGFFLENEADLTLNSWTLEAFDSDSNALTIGDNLGTGLWEMHSDNVNGIQLDYMPHLQDVQGALYNPLQTEGFGAEPNYFTLATLTMIFSDVPIIETEEQSLGSGLSGTTFVRMKNVGEGGEDSLKLPGTFIPNGGGGGGFEVIPEPGTFLLFGAGLLGLGLWGARRKS